MAATRTPGITLDARGDLILDKEYRGNRLFRRLGKISLQDAESILQSEMARLAVELDLRMHARPAFRHCAARYLAESRQKRTADTIAWHVQLLQGYLGDLAPDRIHDGTLKPFVDQRKSEGAGPTTINRSLEVVRTILNRAARAYRDDDGRPWLERVPPMITMLPENPRVPCPISWTEQDSIFQRLPGHLQRMVLFAVNTGLRDSNVCELQWSWEVFVPEVGRSVFVIPPAAFKSLRPLVVILNDAAWSIVREQRGKHRAIVFPYRGHAIRTMNNTAWQRARKEIALPQVRIHDLRHTYGARLRAAGVPAEDRATLLGHSTGWMTDHYASADIGRLIGMANRVLDRTGTRTILRVANG